MTVYYAHTVDGHPETEWQRLEDHLRNVGEAAAGYAEPFAAADWGRLAGLWHDIGKYANTFQQYLRSSSCPDPHVADAAIRTDHSTAGAQHAVQTADILGHLLAYVIAGHHSGLLDGRSEGPCLDARLKKDIQPWQHAMHLLPKVSAPELPSFLKDAFGRKDAFPIAFFTRMLFSCLVDADFLDTERFMKSERGTSRPEWPDDILQRMQGALSAHISKLHTNDAPVNKHRAAVRCACLDAARLPPGLFSLTVPTGGGKTLSSLAFALQHAVRYGLRRVIYVIPFTSIIEQNANEFRRVLAPLSAGGVPDPVVEHHSNIDAGKETQTSRLATENWDAPLIVTTSVQFYESLFANRTSRCRKLHNLAQSVIILDEVQTLPVDYLQPCLQALQELARNYHATIVLCTATQPAIHLREGFPIGLQGVREIIHEPGRLYQDLKRVEVTDLGSQDDTVLGQRLLAEEQVLCIVNTRNHARGLFHALGDGNNHFHLSALMCPEHRSEVIRTIHERLEDRHECRVISTQLIEAGVDIDFPTVYRSLAGLDSIAQAAGRCNREGRLLPRKGRMFVFRSEHTRSELFFAETTNSAAQVLGLYQDPVSLEAIQHYFKLYYWDQSSRWDAKQILREFHLINDRALPFSFAFARVAKCFHIIESTGQAVIIPWGKKGRALCERLRSKRGMEPRELRGLLRRFQRYTVQVPQRIWDKHAGGAIELVHDRYPVLVSPEMHYSRHTGLALDDDQGVFLGV